MTSLNTQFDLIRQSATVAMADRVTSLRAQGRKIIGLQTGDPDFAVGGNPTRVRSRVTKWINPTDPAATQAITQIVKTVDNTSPVPNGYSDPTKTNLERYILIHANDVSPTARGVRYWCRPPAQ